MVAAAGITIHRTQDFSSDAHGSHGDQLFLFPYFADEETEAQRLSDWLQATALNTNTSVNSHSPLWVGLSLSHTFPYVILTPSFSHQDRD